MLTGSAMLPVFRNRSITRTKSSVSIGTLISDMGNLLWFWQSSCLQPGERSLAAHCPSPRPFASRRIEEIVLRFAAIASPDFGLRGMMVESRSDGLGESLWHG